MRCAHVLITMTLGIALVCGCGNRRRDRPAPEQQSPTPRAQQKPRPRPVPAGKIEFRRLSAEELKGVPQSGDQLTRLGYAIRVPRKAELFLRLEDRGRPVISMSSVVQPQRRRLVLLSVSRRTAKAILSEFDDLVGPKAKPIVAKLKQELPDLATRVRGRFWATLGAGVIRGGIPTALMPAANLSRHSGGLAGRGQRPFGQRLHLHFWVWSDAAHRSVAVSHGVGFLKLTQAGKPVDPKTWKWPIWSLTLDTKPR